MLNPSDRAYYEECAAAQLERVKRSTDREDHLGRRGLADYYLSRLYGADGRLSDGTHLGVANLLDHIARR
jgi:hypothetical protein